MRKPIDFCLHCSQVIASLMAVLLLVWSFSINTSYLLSFNFLNLNSLDLSISVGADDLSRLMLSVVLFVGFVIYVFAKNYLDSDRHRCRFLMQFILLIASVCLLVLSKNLLTAFVAWQFIGLTLYLLLNHHHTDWQANRAAKKKFIINRVGDLCFLLAVVLSYHWYGTSDYSALFATQVSVWVPALIFVAVMTKSAQFPFHIWLPDTLEAPTPVSAVMHAGIINAGGFLLVRLAPMLLEHLVLMGFIAIIGLVTASVGLIFYHYQADIKKKLAYSTVSQMGYMVFQCGLGAFPAAIFHLISHGFYKASLFLNSGNALFDSHTSKKMTWKGTILAALFAFVSLAVLQKISLAFHHSVEPILLGFFFITLASSFQNIFKSRAGVISTVIQVLLVLAFLLAYVLLLKSTAIWVGFTLVKSGLSMGTQYLLVVLIVLIFYALQFTTWRPKSTILWQKGRVEAFYRAAFLEPIRHFGDFGNRLLKGQVFFGIILLLFLSLVALCLPVLHVGSVSIALIVGFLVFSALLANRSPALRLIFSWLGAFTLANTWLLIFLNPSKGHVLAWFYLINFAPIFLMLMSILMLKPSDRKHAYPSVGQNRLSWIAFYVSAALLCLIGIPGTASFVAELYLFIHLLQLPIFILILNAVAMFLLAIAVMHALQTTVFSAHSPFNQSVVLSYQFHVLAWFAIAFNVFNGCFPRALLHWLGGL